MTYSEKLKDPRWQKKRLEVLGFANWKCEECDSASDTLSVHHSHYIKGREPWDYENNLLHALCDKCHQERAQIEEGLKLAIMQMTRFIPTKRLKAMAMRSFGEAYAETEGE